ncbi:DUF3857 domain-containing protein [Hymenobacter sediminicola]|uniref:DUF3857 domain-containing protein n=1 Tax=Hymenobacter sediminicola TaxID=2761579 RepID=A0A7G7W9A5_9BACT|nr:DUF3857 domain-containing protein [Hymenobacter sediminicola]QNH62948.1 DUF3857 domain-containing protein [Hymenobacter sediminicola]
MTFLSAARAATAALLLATAATPVWAQQIPKTLQYATYSWDAKRTKRLPVSEEEAKQPALVLRDFTAHEYMFSEQDKAIKLYSTEHRILRVNTSDGIERFNKIYIPQDGGQLLYLKARTISPRGEVVEVNEGSIKELKDEDGGRGFKIFAVEGVEKGSEIEYLFLRERPAKFFGRDYLQSTVPTRDVSFELISPEALTFDTRVYHGPAASPDTVIAGKHHIRMKLASVPAAREETFAQSSAERMRVEYKLAYTAQRGRTRLFTWADASQYLHGTIYTLAKDETKAADKVLRDAKLPASGDLASRVQALENYLKTSFNITEGGETNLSRIAATKNASELGMTRLFVALLRRLNIEHELVVTTDRSDVVFDDTFDTWNYLDNYALYFPETKQLLAPARPDFRYGMVPPGWTANKGLFIRTVKLGSTESAVGVVRDVPTLAAEQSPNDLDIKVKFAPELDKAFVDIRQVLGGYHAQAIQPFYSLIPEEKRTEVMQSLVKGNVPDATFKSVKVTNGEAGLSPLSKPFLVDASVESAALLNKAGQRYLFKIGDLLGQQSELYQAEARQYDVENDFNRRYNRVITLELPAGYQVRNLQDLNADVKAGSDAKDPLYYFNSKYAVQGQTVTVTITEAYRQIRWPKKDFEAFRDVVNAAANFNKVVLVLEKKS